MRKWMLVLGLALGGSCVVQASDLADVRDSHDPASQVQIVPKYRDYQWCVKERRMMLEADDVPPAAIKDSLRAVPKGGELYVQVPKEFLDKAKPHVYGYAILDDKGKVLVQAEASDAAAVQADEAKLMDLVHMSIPVAVKGDLTLRMTDKATGQRIEFIVPSSGD